MGPDDSSELIVHHIWVFMVQACLLEHTLYTTDADLHISWLALHLLMAFLCSSLHIGLNAWISNEGLQQFRQKILCRLQYIKHLTEDRNRKREYRVQDGCLIGAVGTCTQQGGQQA